SILRRLLGMSLPDRASASRNGDAKGDQNQELSEFLQSTRLLGSRTATKRYLQILGFAYKHQQESFDRILSFSAGRSRIYFARSKEEIERSGRSTHPRRIPGSPFWALTNTDTPQKRDLLSTALKTLGYAPTVVREAVETID